MLIVLIAAIIALSCLAVWLLFAPNAETFFRQFKNRGKK